MKNDFFISYTGSDRQWAEWIAWQLEFSGYNTVLQAWDFHAGGNFVLQMQEALVAKERTVAVLSPGYLEKAYTKPEWAAVFAEDPTGEKGVLIPVRIKECQLQGLHKAIVYIDLVNLQNDQAKIALLQRIEQTTEHTRLKPEREPVFPGSALNSTKNEPRFPGTLPPVWNLPRRNPNFTGRIQVLEDIRESLNCYGIYFLKLCCWI